jgi:hypothetical protein
MKKNIVYLAVLMLIMAACREKIDLPLDSTYQRLVVEGGISSDTTSHMVILSKSTDAYGRQSVEYISGALVTISDSIQTFYLSEDPQQKGHYRTQPDVFGVVGRTYTLNIENVDIDGDGNPEHYTAVTRMVKPFRIDNLRLIPFSFRSKGYLLQVYGQVPEARTQFMLRIYKNNQLLNDSIHEMAITNSVDTSYVYGDIFYFLSDNQPNEKVELNDTITLEMLAIDYDYYQFLRAVNMEYGPKSPLFGSQSANIPTNIKPSEKAMGYFSAFAISRASVVRRQ